MTPQESAVAACLLDGLTQREAAAAIGVAKSTVWSIEMALSQRFGARNRIALALKLKELA